MPKSQQTPANALSSLMEEYQLTAFSLSKKIGLSNSAIRQILIDKSGITVPTALRLSKFFGQPPAFWLDLQLQEDLQKAANDKELQTSLKGITKAAKPKPQAKENTKGKTAAPAKGRPKAKPAKKTTPTDKRKQAAKAPDAKPASRKPAVKK